jgi:hypothetical protein
VCGQGSAHIIHIFARIKIFCSSMRAFARALHIIEVNSRLIVNPPKECKMNWTQRALTALLLSASFTVSGAAPAQVSAPSAGPYYGFAVPSAEADSASAARGSLGVSVEDLSLSNNLGKMLFLLNGGYALLFGAFVCFAAARHRRAPTRDHDPLGNWNSGNSVTSI